MCTLFGVRVTLMFSWYDRQISHAIFSLFIVLSLFSEMITFWFFDLFQIWEQMECQTVNCFKLVLQSWTKVKTLQCAAAVASASCTWIWALQILHAAGVLLLIRTVPVRAISKEDGQQQATGFNHDFNYFAILQLLSFSDSVTESWVESGVTHWFTPKYDT
jgi:hypothetical protein